MVPSIATITVYAYNLINLVWCLDFISVIVFDVRQHASVEVLVTTPTESFHCSFGVHYVRLMPSTGSAS